MNNIKVVDWISDEEASDKTVICGGLGGWFNSGMFRDGETGHRWEDYLTWLDPAKHPYAEAIRVEILEKNLVITGSMHQEEYTPLFSDGTVGSYSFRGWGDLMAAIFSEAEDKDYNYMDFYYIYWKGYTLQEFAKLQEKIK